MFRRITVGLKGGMLPVASVAERLLKLGGCAPDCVLARPALGAGGPGCKLADHAGESDWLALCDCQWPLALCQWASGFGGAGLRVSPSSESLGWSSSSSVCLHCALCTCVCQCTGGGGGSQQHSLEDPRIIAFGGGGGGIGGGP